MASTTYLTSAGLSKYDELNKKYNEVKIVPVTTGLEAGVLKKYEFYQKATSTNSTGTLIDTIVIPNAIADTKVQEAILVNTPASGSDPEKLEIKLFYNTGKTATDTADVTIDLADLLTKINNLDTTVNEYQTKTTAKDVINVLTADDQTAGSIQKIVKDAADGKAVTIKEVTTGLASDVLKSYEFYQGGEAEGNKIGTINLAKDLVVTSGKVVTIASNVDSDSDATTGLADGSYIKLTIANQTAPVYINVADLVDTYTVEQNASEVQVAISASNEISATLNSTLKAGYDGAVTKVGTAAYQINNVDKTIKEYIDSRIFVGTQEAFDAAKTAGTVDETAFAVITSDSAESFEPIIDSTIESLFA